MRTDLLIPKIHTVFEGEFIPGTIAGTPTGRHCDGFVCYLYGEAHYRFPNMSFTVTDKQFFYLAKGSTYEITVTKPVKYICVNFDFEAPNAHPLDPQDSSLFKKAAPGIPNIFMKLFKEWNIKSTWGPSKCLSYVYSLYAEGIKAQQTDYAPVPAGFSELMDFVLTHYTCSDFSIQQIAAHANVSQVYLRRMFHSVLNTSPVKYLNYLRLEKAKNMLLTSNYSITEIAAACGIPDPYYFSRLFKNEIGMTPSQFRKSSLTDYANETHGSLF